MNTILLALLIYAVGYFACMIILGISEKISKKIDKNYCIEHFDEIAKISLIWIIVLPIGACYLFYVTMKTLWDKFVRSE